MVQARALLVAIALTVTVPPALAGTAAEEKEKQIQRDCTADALRHCALAIPKGRPAIIACMIENKGKLRPKCRQHIY